MSKRKMVTIDGNQAAAYVAHKTNEVIAIYPITPSSPMGEWSDEWSARGQKNIWGTVPRVTEMQSEGGASGAVHGALQSGALTTTFTASQGLLLMIPNMYKIAGELTSTVFHVSARSLAAQALSIFGDHSDVMAVRQTGFALMPSGNVQEVMDFALIAQAATLESRVPFLHFFDGFRTSHEVSKVEEIDEETIRQMINDELVRAHRQRALSPDKPVIRGTAQNPDVYFQGRETVNPFYLKVPEIVQKAMDKFAKLTGRQYRLFDYVGHPEAERVIILMGSGAEAAHETAEFLASQGEKVGVIKVRLYRPFSIKHLIEALPATVKAIAVLDRTKEPGSAGEPMYLDVVNAMVEAQSEGALPFAFPKITGGRYGLSSKEFTPAMVKAVFDELKKDKPKNHFTIGIIDDVTHTSLEWDRNFSIEPDDVFRGMFYGLGSDGTVGANKNSIKIIGEGTENYAQGYFVYDSKKSGAITISHLRFGKKPIRSTYLINRANFIAVHQFVFLEQFNVLENAVEGATFLINTPYPKEEVWDKLPRVIQEEIIKKKLKVYVIDAYEVAKKTGMGGRINTIMQTCFFAISGVLPRDEAIAKIKDTIQKTYGKKGDQIVQMNFNAVDQSLAHLHELEIPEKVTSTIELKPPVPENAPDFVKDVTATIISMKGDELPVSKMPVDGTFPTGTTKWEKRNIALEVPVWDSEICIQCNKCVEICPHAAIRAKVYDGEILKDAPANFKATKARGKEWPEGYMYTLQVAVEDCTGCELCVEFCPVKDKREAGRKAINMHPQIPLREQERANWDFFLNIPEFDRTKLRVNTVKDSQFLEPLFEFSGACPGCGETPYIKLATQLFGDRMLIANATGCSSIYGGNLPTTPYTFNKEGRGPAWSNSLFEDNAEFGLGFRLAIDKHNEQAKELVEKLKDKIGAELAEAILSATQRDESEIFEQRQRVEDMKKKLQAFKDDADVQNLLSLADYLVKKSVWIIGGDGWAYDIGYGGLDHVMASGRNVNILVLDTEVYSNTGGQMSKATPLGAVAKFAASGKPNAKKDLALKALTYGNVYVARVAMGANDTQTLKAFLEAEHYDGPSIIIAYSHCIAHGYNLKYGAKQQKLAVETGNWPLFRYNPELVQEGKNPLILDSKAPTKDIAEFMNNETRFKMVQKMNPTLAQKYLKEAQEIVKRNWKFYEHLSKLSYSTNGENE
ncbi:pyruvate ferredoxin/flavodoxin oxidoreductase [Caldithrix abyssi DSM 13497]|uniref:Pyruvate-ferredoxin/flavodoxin oxidoreductase n=1 Tax=Caldithrix abyssi DSM 13497 TaxID=880073 RepID=H1XQM1_CALAY|nr:pyruvate:ferredoxin (flavodoxin) oxidoreductase [Caldithrix abyssi]APF17013.1 pyruvate-ferredoxin/flavodoxin oxidoreductase [Caldithrix abyssi DSM 13497]EHO41167.1 pyruvate ferredoxin/flavodoxin oxidoreductase [Caldithrix abyssi DSM 13497]